MMSNIGGPINSVFGPDWLFPRCHPVHHHSFGIDFNLVEKDIWFWLDIFLSNVDLLRFGYYRFRVGGIIPTNKKVVDMYDVEGFVAIQFFSHHLFLKIVLRSNWLHKGSYTCWSHQFSHAEEIRISEQGLD